MKRALQRVKLRDLGRTQHKTNALYACKQALKSHVTLAHRDESKRLCFYIDALDTHWAEIATQIPREDMHLPHCDKHHEPVAVLSGHFTQTPLRWSTLEKRRSASWPQLNSCMG